MAFAHGGCAEWMTGAFGCAEFQVGWFHVLVSRLSVWMHTRGLGFLSWLKDLYGVGVDRMLGLMGREHCLLVRGDTGVGMPNI